MISSHSRQRRIALTSEPGQDLIEFLQQQLNKKWDITADMIVVKSENDNRWQILSKERADELKVNGKTIKEQLNIQSDDDRIDLIKIIGNLSDAKKHTEGYPIDSTEHVKAMDEAVKMKKEWGAERKPHRGFFRNENRFTAKNRELKETHERIDNERKQRFKKKEEEQEQEPDEMELPMEQKQKQIEDEKKKFKDEFKPKRANRDRKGAEWRDFDEDKGDDE